VSYDKEEVVLKDIDNPTISQQDVLIRIAYCALSNMDIDSFHFGNATAYPQIFGHEFSGIVEETGLNVKNLQIGDRVIANPIISCGKCADCKEGKSENCTDFSFVGVDLPGCMAEYISIPAANCIKIPEAMSLKEASLIGPATVVLDAIHQANIDHGSQVVVIGASMVGILFARMLQVMDIDVTLVDVSEKRLETAKGLGISNYINLTTDQEFRSDSLKSENKHFTFVLAGNRDQFSDFLSKIELSVTLGNNKKETTISKRVFQQILQGEYRNIAELADFRVVRNGEWKKTLQFLVDHEISLEPFIAKEYDFSQNEIPFHEALKLKEEGKKVLYKVQYVNE
jgi:L-iditol 2-dehydrogenase/galactitol-1-phosphate 5-dehydrogenase